MSLKQRPKQHDSQLQDEQKTKEQQALDRNERHIRRQQKSEEREISEKKTVRKQDISDMEQKQVQKINEKTELEEKIDLNEKREPGEKVQVSKAEEEEEIFVVNWDNDGPGIKKVCKNGKWYVALYRHETPDKPFVTPLDDYIQEFRTMFTPDELKSIDEGDRKDISPLYIPKEYID